MAEPCTCSAHGPGAAESCVHARRRADVSLSGRRCVRIAPCGCRCHWQPHRSDCEGGEDCICRRMLRERSLHPTVHAWRDGRRPVLEEALAAVHGRAA